MYINVNGNVHATCSALTEPIYREEVGESRVEMTSLFAQCKEMTAHGIQHVNLSLLFFDGFAIPATKIKVGSMLVIDGRESSKEYRKRSEEGGRRYALERTVIIEAWDFRILDPGGMLQQLAVRREYAIREKEMQDLFAEWLSKCKDTILGWFIEWVKANRNSNSRKE